MPPFQSEFRSWFPGERFYAFGGWPLPDIVRQLHRDCLGSEATEEFVSQFLAEKKAAYAEWEAQNGSPPVITAVATIARALAAAGVPVVAATSGRRDHVEHHLECAGLADLFKTANIICAADLPPGRGKPCPDIFIAAAKMAGADPARCVAFEDAEAGLESAFTAGCQTVDVRLLDGYPLPAGLRAAMPEQASARSGWIE